MIYIDTNIIVPEVTIYIIAYEIFFYFITNDKSILNVKSYVWNISRSRFAVSQKSYTIKIEISKTSSFS